MFKTNRLLNSPNSDCCFQYWWGLPSQDSVQYRVKSHQLHCHYFLKWFKCDTILLVAVVENPQLMCFLLFGTFLYLSCSDAKSRSLKYMFSLRHTCSLHWKTFLNIYLWKCLYHSESLYFWTILVLSITSIWMSRCAVIKMFSYKDQILVMLLYLHVLTLFCFFFF